MIPMFRQALLSVFLFPFLALSDVHDVPGRKQLRPDNCGPTAVTSCLGWFQNHGYPDLKTRGGRSGLDDIQEQIDKDSRSSDRETKDHERTVDELGHALEKLLKGGPYQRRLTPGKPGPTDLKDFRYLDTEFSHGEDIILLIRFGDMQGHFITVRNITPNASGGRTIEYMDPADGGTHSIDVKQEGAKLKLTYDGKNGFIENALTLSPANTTESTKPKDVDPANPGAGKKVTYRPYFPKHAVPKDLHILVSDCDLSHYNVSGLPARWTVTVQHIGGKCYLTVNRGSATTDLKPGQEIEVVYRGRKKFVPRDHAVIQTSDGGTTMTSPLTDDPGQAIADSEVEPPGPVGGLICSVGEGGAAGPYNVRLQWGQVARAARYVIRDTYGGAVLGRTATPAIGLELQPDTLYSLTVAAELDDSAVTGQASDPVVFHRDEAFGLVASAGGQQTLEYVSTLTSWHRPYSWKITIPGADHETRINVTTVVGDLDPSIPAGIGRPQSRWYHFAAAAGLRTGPIVIEIPYGPEVNNPRLYALVGGVWTEVTDRVDVEQRMISGKFPALGSVAVVDVPAPDNLIQWTIPVALLLVVLSLLLSARYRRRRAGESH